MNEKTYYYVHKELFIEKISINEIVLQTGTPILVYSLRTLKQNGKLLINAFQKSGINFQLYYSYKACPLIDIVKVFHALGIGAEVGSEYEFLLAIKAGCPPEKIVWNSVCKSDNELDLALSYNLSFWHIDALKEAYKLNKALKKKGEIQKVILRIYPDISSNYILPGSKLGHPVSSSQALHACKQILSLSNLKLSGFHCHSIVNQKDPKIFGAIARAMREFIDTVKLEFKIDIEYINLGGGFASFTDMNKHRISIDEIVLNIQKAFENFNGIIAFEPGRILVNNAAIAIGTLLAKKESFDKKWWITDINTSLLIPFGGRRFNFIPGVIDKNNNIVHVAIGDRSSTYSGILNPQVLIKDCKCGSIIVATDCGAYTYSTRQLFIYPEHHVVLVNGRNISLIK